jgi:hypothetical protein
MGRCRIGVAKVLSTIETTPAFFALGGCLIKVNQAVNGVGGRLEPENAVLSPAISGSRADFVHSNKTRSHTKLLRTFVSSLIVPP